MGIHDRDYMRGQPDDDEALEQYERERFDAEYGEVATSRKRFVRWVVGVLAVILLLGFVAVWLNGRS
ncbi:hypothetical protein HQ590_10525 [bacterium]|nr:hypothetical protein [bacterium]